ncbi:MAG: hypothetical protein HYT16_00880 [DPANN group archaeon]|nr:hypothetical protein [DPANN group archaeon]
MYFLTIICPTHRKKDYKSFGDINFIGTGPKTSLDELLALLESAGQQELTEAVIPAFLRNINLRFRRKGVDHYSRFDGEWHYDGVVKFENAMPAKARPGVTLVYERTYLTHYLADGPVRFAFLQRKDGTVFGAYLNGFTASAWLLRK